MSISSTPTPPSNITAVLRCLGAAAPLIPVPGIAPAIGIVISILEVVDSIRSGKKNCRSLAEKAAQLVLSIHTEASKLDCESATYKRIQENIEPFRRILDQIKEFITKVSRANLAKQLWRRDAILERLSELTSSLDSCYQTFQITSIVHLQTLLAQLKDEHAISSEKLHQQLLAFHRATIKTSEEGVNQLTAEIRAVKHDIDYTLRIEGGRSSGLLQEIAVHVKKELTDSKLGNEWIITQRELLPTRVHTFRTKDHAGIILAKYKGQDVIVKKFNAVDTFIREMNTWREIWHPCLPQFIGHSSESDKDKFIVLRGGFIARNIRQFLYGSFDKDPITGLLKGLDILYGVSVGVVLATTWIPTNFLTWPTQSAISYLRTEAILTKDELEKCLQLSSIALSESNEVILGESLVSCATQKRNIPDCHRNTSMEIFLSSEFFGLCLKMICPDSRFRPLHVSSGHGPYSLLRLLLSFPSQGPQGRSMSQVFARLESVWLAVNELKHTKAQITFKDIREAFLSVADLPASRPSPLHYNWDISAGSLGYVRHDEFVCLTNALNNSSDLCAEPTELFEIHCDPPRPYIVQSISDDWDRYEFDSPAYVYFWHSAGNEIDGISAFRHLLECAPQYLERYKDHSIAPSDLILVCKKETVPRCYGEFSYRSTDDESCNPPRKVFFFLKKTRISGEAWGYWSLDPDWVQLPPGSASNIVDSRIECSAEIYKQFFNFVQLEREDEIGPQKLVG